jgi:hypothetical protein
MAAITCCDIDPGRQRVVDGRTGLPLHTTRIIEPTPTRQLVDVYRAQRPLSLAVKSFIDLLSDELTRASNERATDARKRTARA